MASSCERILPRFFLLKLRFNSLSNCARIDRLASHGSSCGGMEELRSIIRVHKPKKMNSYEIEVIVSLLPCPANPKRSSVRFEKSRQPLREEGWQCLALVLLDQSCLRCSPASRRSNIGPKYGENNKSGRSVRC